MTLADEMRRYIYEANNPIEGVGVLRSIFEEVVLDAVRQAVGDVLDEAGIDPRRVTMTLKLRYR